MKNDGRWNKLLLLKPSSITSPAQWSQDSERRASAIPPSLDLLQHQANQGPQQTFLGGNLKKSEVSPKMVQWPLWGPLSLERDQLMNSTILRQDFGYTHFLLPCQQCLKPAIPSLKKCNDTSTWTFYCLWKLLFAGDVKEVVCIVSLAYKQLCTAGKSTCAII